MPDETGRFAPPDHYGPEVVCGEASKAWVLHHERIARRHQPEAACHEPTDAEVDAAELALRFVGKKAVPVVTTRQRYDEEGQVDG